MRALGLLAVFVAAVPAAASTPAGTLRSKPQHTHYPSGARCRAALNRWADERRAEESANPTVAPHLFELKGPMPLEGQGTGFILTRVTVLEEPVRMNTSYIYEHSCKGRTYITVSDGYQSSPMPALPPAGGKGS